MAIVATRRHYALELVIDRSTSGTHLGNIARYFEMLRVALVGLDILPCAEFADKADIEVGLLRIGNVDTNLLADKHIDLATQREQALLDDLGIFEFGMPLCLVLQTEKYNMFDHCCSKLVSRWDG